MENLEKVFKFTAVWSFFMKTNNTNDFVCNKLFINNIYFKYTNTPNVFENFELNKFFVKKCLNSPQLFDKGSYGH